MRRAVALLAILATLLAAPSAALGAANQLSAAIVAPHIGTTATPFTFTVVYAGFAPDTVRVNVAGMTLAMSLQAGTPASGVWVASTTLPAGTWPVTFTASVSRGNVANLTGPSIHVSGSATTAATPGASTSPVDPGGGEPPDAAPVPTPSPRPTTATDPAPPPSVADPAPTAALLQPAPAAPVAPAPPSGSAVASPAGTPSATIVPASRDRGVARAPRPSSSGILAGAGAAEEDAEPVLSDEPNLVVIGLTGVTAAAVAGAGLLFAIRRRRRAGAVAAAVADDTSATLERRAVRQARRRLGDDPIVAAMGIGSDKPKRRVRKRP